MLRLLFLVTTFFSFTWAVHESFINPAVDDDQDLSGGIVLSAASFDSDSEDDDSPKDHDDWEQLAKLVPQVEKIFNEYPPQNINHLVRDVEKENFLRHLAYFDGIMSLYLSHHISHNGIAPFFSPEQLCIATGSHFKGVAQEIASSPKPDLTLESFIRNLEKFLKNVKEII